MKRVFFLWLMALWMGAISVFSVQNATPVRIRFLAWQSIHLPFGVVLTLGVMIGLLLPLVLSRRQPSRHF